MTKYVVFSCYFVGGWRFAIRLSNSPFQPSSTQTAPGSFSYSDIYINTAYRFSFHYPGSFGAVSPYGMEGPVAYVSGVSDDAEGVEVYSNNSSSDETFDVYVHSPTDTFPDLYEDPPSFWKRDVKVIANNVYSLGQKDSETISAPVEKTLAGEPSYWMLITATKQPDGKFQASIGWNGLGEVRNGLCARICQSVHSTRLCA